MNLLASRIARSPRGLVETPQGLESYHVDSAVRWLVYLDKEWFEKYGSVASGFAADFYAKNRRRPLPSTKEDVSRHLVKVYEWRSGIPTAVPAVVRGRNEVLGLLARALGLSVNSLAGDEDVQAWQSSIEDAGSVASVLQVLGYGVDAVDDFIVDYCAVQDMLTRRRWTKTGYSAQVDDWLDLVILDAASMVGQYGPNAWPVLVDLARGWKVARSYEQLRRTMR